MDLTQLQENEVIKILKYLREAEQKGREAERKKLLAEIEEKQNAERKELSEWVDTKEALKIINRKSVNTLNKWVDEGFINPPKKIGRFLSWERANLLRMSPYGS